MIAIAFIAVPLLISIYAFYQYLAAAASGCAGLSAILLEKTGCYPDGVYGLSQQGHHSELGILRVPDLRLHGVLFRYVVIYGGISYI